MPVLLDDRDPPANWLTASPLFRRFWEFAGAVSIRVKVLGIVLGVVCLLGIFAIIQMNRVLTATLLRDLVEQGAALTVQTATDATALAGRYNPDLLHAFLVERRWHFSTESHNTQVAYITLESAAGVWIAGDKPDTRSAGLLPYVDEAATLPHTVRVAMNYGFLDFSVSLPDDLGVLHLGLSLETLHRTVNQVLLQLAAITLVMMAVGFSAAFFLTWILTRPILALVGAANAVARGDLGYRVSRWADDEIGELSTAFNSMTASLQEAERERSEREQMRARYVSNIILAQENERQRIARELHDSTGQSLTSLLVGLQTLKLAEAADERRGRIDELRRVVASTLDEVRALSWGLRPSVLDDLGLVSALRHYLDDYQNRYGIQVHHVVSGLEERLPPEMETTIYRIVQEGLTNIARHAQANHVAVILSCRQRVLRIIVEDNGIGFTPEASRAQPKSLGLQGIRERTGLFNGSFAIESMPGRGTTLTIEIPLPHDDKTLEKSPNLP